MKLLFHINYQTVFGEELLVNVLQKGADGQKAVSQYRLATINGWDWDCEINIDNDTETLEYYYSIECGQHEKRREWTAQRHVLETNNGRGTYRLYDRWIDMPGDSFRYSSAFTECLNRHVLSRPQSKHFNKTLRLKVCAPQLLTGERLFLLGNTTTLGAWKMENAIEMTNHSINEWVVDADASDMAGKMVEFKFMAVSASGDKTWESRNNRELVLPTLYDGDTVCYEESEAYFDIYNVRCAGTLVPVFSLRSKKSFGVGDFGDLRMMIDWVAQTHQRVLQVLPINDTTTTHTWTDSYPYSCISIFALHPQYANLRALPQLNDKKDREHYERLRLELNNLPQIDYERVNNAKTEYLHKLYLQEGATTLKGQPFKQFFESNKTWLVPYAEYCWLRDTTGTFDFNQWKGHELWSEADRKALETEGSEAYTNVAFYYYVQFILSSQMREVHDYARSKGVILKGDIPIGVNRHGCDVWSEPRYFNLNSQAGAPPDDFSVNGQNWGFPTYNWEEMLKDDCAWWVRRFKNMQQYFDAYRIDHVLGFFRIWEIPIDAVHGLLGQFAPSLGMTREEVEGYGLHWQEELFTEPFIADWVLDRVFHERAQEVKDKYLLPKGNGLYKMRPEFDTQRKVEKAFEGCTSKEDLWLRDGLYALISDVLFLRDHRDPNRFHPRISVQFDFIYQWLWDSDKGIFNKLYNDYYYRRNNQFWYQEAMKKLPRLVQATRMLVCAEDLGMVPDCVPWVMDELRILSLEIQSMPKDPHVRFGHLSRNPYRSVATISTHDMPTMRQWWDENQERTQDYYNNMLYREGPAPHPLPGWLARDIVSRHLTCPSMLCILAIQDWMAIDENLRLADPNAERINIPANPHHYWRYRMHVCIEDLIANKDFSANVSELVIESGR